MIQASTREPDKMLLSLIETVVSVVPGNDPKFIVVEPWAPIAYSRYHVVAPVTRRSAVP